jgi:hypothetical protein
MKLPIALAGAVALCLTSTFAAAQTTVVNTFKDWTLYSHTGEPADICFLTSQPKEATPAGARGDRSFFYVSSWPKDGVKAEISIKIGRPLKGGAPVIVQIGNNRFELFTKGDKAFVSDPTEELKLLDAMKRGSFMVIKLTTQEGQLATETYSLIGVTKAINTLTQGCG